MSTTNDTTPDSLYIRYNSLISLSIISEEYENTPTTKYLIAEENLEHSLSFKLCRKPLKEYLDLKESFFYIRNKDECSNFGSSENKKNKSKKDESITKELRFLSKDKIHQNSPFYLQHMLSKKYVSIVKTQDNNFLLKLLANSDNAATFLLRKINEKRNSKELLTTKEIFYLSIYRKEEDQFYYLKDDNNPNFKINNYYYNVLVSKKQITQFYITDQCWNMDFSKNIYSGQLINIIFTRTKGNKEEQLMLCVEKKEQNPPEDLIIFNNENNNNDNNNNKNNVNDSNEYRIICIPYTNELYEHVLNNCFWIIEEELDYYNCFKKPIQIGQSIRIKNVHTGLYLRIRKKDDNNEKSDSVESSSFSFENNYYEFILVDELKLNKLIFWKYNFIFYNYMLDSLSSEIVDDGKYILKSVFRKRHVFHLNDKED
jgi:hypothetical protein